MDYHDALINLRRDWGNRWPSETRNKAPYKPVLLLAVMDMIAQRKITDNWIELSDELEERFGQYCRSVLSEGVGDRNIRLRFARLASESFWHLQPIPGQEDNLHHAIEHNERLELQHRFRSLVRGATLDDALFHLLSEVESREALRRVLIEEHFSPAVHPRLLEISQRDSGRTAMDSLATNKASTHSPLIWGNGFGDPPGVAVHQLFANRRELAAAGVHQHLQAGIAGSEAHGAASVVLADGYEDVKIDEETGVVLYSGFGGRDANTGKQIADQQLRHWNKALAKSCVEGLPIRVIRKASNGYQYLGLYRCSDYGEVRGRSGFLVWRYRLKPFDDGMSFAPGASPTLGGNATSTPIRHAVTIQRILRSTFVAQTVKDLHRHCCQICGICLRTLAGPYSEAAHIQPLGKPHGGPDIAENVICLCPNHHALFDLGALVIGDDFRVVNTITGVEIAKLRLALRHHVGSKYLAYHRRRFSGISNP